MNSVYAPGNTRAREDLRQASTALVYLSLLSALLLATYWPSWTITPYADDFLLLIAVEAGIGGGAYAGQFMFRPLELLVLQLSYALTDGPGLARAISFVAFLASIALVFRLAMQIAPQLPALPFVATAVFACHPVNVATVAQIDTVSQDLATLTVLGAFAWYLLGPRHRPALYHGAGAALIVLALLSKEVVVGTMFALPGAVAMVDLWARSQPWPTVARRALAIGGVVLALFLIYLGLRGLAGAVLLVEEDYHRYTFASGPLNTLKNVVLLLGSAAWLGSTLDVFLTGDPLRRALSALVSLAVNGLAVAGLLVILRDFCQGLAERRSLVMIGAVALMLLASLFPVALTGWPSEVHSFLPVPFYALLVTFFALRGGAALAGCLRLSPRRAGALGLAALVLVGAWMLVGVRHKLDHAAAVSARSEAFLEQITAWYRTVDPAQGVRSGCVEEVAPPARVYSVYAMPSYALLQPIADWLNHRMGPRLLLPVVPDTVEDCGVVIEVDGSSLRLHESGTP
jgi:hypothetical protein